MASNPRWSYSGSSTGVLYTDRRDFYLSPHKVAELWGMLTPFWSWASKLSTVETQDPDFKLFQHESKLVDDMIIYGTATNAGDTLTAGSAISSTWGVDDGSGSAPVVGHQVGTLVEIRDSNDNYKCTAIISTCATINAQSIKVTPIWVSGTQVTADNDKLYIIGFADEEGNTSPTAWADELEVVWGSAQINKTPVELTGTLLKMTKLRGYSSELARLRSDKYNEHNIGKNRSFLFGIRYPALTGAPTTTLTGSNSRNIRTTWGIVSAIRRHGTSNVNKFARAYGTYSWDDFVDDLKLSFKYKNLQGIKYAFCGAGVIGFFSKRESGIMGNSQFAFNIAADEVPTRFGFDVRTIKHPYGTLKLVYEPCLRGQYDNTMVIVDPENIQRVVFRQPMYQTAIQAPDADLHKDQYFSDEGLGITNIKSHSLYEFA